MGASTNRPAVFAAMLALFVVLWLVSAAFLAYVTCASYGGTLAGRGYSCLLPDGKQLPWFALHSLTVFVANLGAAGIVPFLLYRWFMRSKWYGA